MRLLLHYGMPKTGTTSLQHALHRSRRVLRDRGVLYPASRHPAEDHRILTALFKPPQDIDSDTLRRFGGNPEKVQAAARSVFEGIRRQVAQNRTELMVLSSEYFYTKMTIEGQRCFRELLSELTDDITICVYFREPSDHYLSTVQQAVKRGFRLWPPFAMQERRRVEVIERAFDRPVIACISDRDHLLGGDIVQDFVRRFLPTHPGDTPVAPVRLNESISAEAMAILDSYRTWRRPESGARPLPNTALLVRTIAAIEARNGRFHKPRLKPQWVEAIRCASTDLIWMRDSYGLVFAGVDYATIDGRAVPDIGPAPRVEDIIEVDGAWRDAILLEILDRGLDLERRRDSFRLHAVPRRVLRRLGRVIR